MNEVTVFIDTVSSLSADVIYERPLMDPKTDPILK